jgi:hypothetical protein
MTEHMEWTRMHGPRRAGMVFSSTPRNWKWAMQIFFDPVMSPELQLGLRVLVTLVQTYTTL